MEKAFQKFLRVLLLEKFPHIQDVHVTYSAHPFLLHKGYEVFLIILEKDWEESKDDYRQNDEIRKLIHNLSKYLDVEVSGIYNEVLSDEEWEESKLDQNDSK